MMTVLDMWNELYNFDQELNADHSAMFSYGGAERAQSCCVNIQSPSSKAVKKADMIENIWENSKVNLDGY